MIIAVGSPNPVKVRAVERAFDYFFDEVKVESMIVDSGVKAFPDTEEMIFKGASNRAMTAYSERFDYSVGIEGGVVLLDGVWYDRNYVIVYDGEETGIGTSASYVVPTHLVEGVDSESDESKKIIDEAFGVKDVFTNQGVIGVLTCGVIDREKLLMDAVVCALTRFINKEYYPEGKV